MLAIRQVVVHVGELVVGVEKAFPYCRQSASKVGENDAGYLIARRSFFVVVAVVVVVVVVVWDGFKGCLR